MTLHRWVVLALLITGVGSVVTWFAARDRLPASIRIATGEPGGLYHHLAGALRDTLAGRSGSAIELVATRGSLEATERHSSPRRGARSNGRPVATEIYSVNSCVVPAMESAGTRFHRRVGPVGNRQLSRRQRL